VIWGRMALDAGPGTYTKHQRPLDIPPVDRLRLGREDLDAGEEG
jgi:hypothetical protein